MYITARDVQKFIWQDIIYYFGIPYKIILDNGKQFKDSIIKEFYNSLGVRHNFLVPYHPQANGLLEASTKMLLARFIRDSRKKKAIR